MATDLYKNGLPWHRNEFTVSLDEQLDKRIDINMASVILIDGGQGQGKTTLAVHIADYFNKRRGLPPMSLNKKEYSQLGLGGVEFVSKFNKCRSKNLPVLIYDEAGDYSRASTLSFFNYQLSKIFQKIRSAKVIILMCLPNFNILDNRIFDDEIIRGAIHCHGRQQTVSYGNFDVYDIEGLSWVRHWYGKLPSARRRSCYGMSSPLFQSHFKNLPNDRARRLEILSNYGKDKERRMAEVHMKGLIRIDDICKEVNRGVSWVRYHLGIMNIKPVEKIGTVNYYHKSVMYKFTEALKR